jgi:hypothetical protein
MLLGHFDSSWIQTFVKFLHLKTFQLCIVAFRISMMQLLTWSLILVLLRIVCGEEDQPSLTFIKRESIELIAGKWLIAVDLPMKNLSDPLSDIIVKLNIIRNQTDLFLSSASNDFKTEGKTIVGEILGTLEDEANTLNLRLNRLIQPIPDQRHSRALIDILGRGLHAIAGVATDEELEDANHKLDILAAKNKEIIHVLESQMTLYKGSNKVLESHEKSINRLDVGINALKDIVLSSYQLANQKTDSIFKEIHFINSVLSTYTYARHNLNLIAQEIERYERAENEAWNSRLTTDLLEPSVFLNLLRSIQSSLPASLSLITYPSDSNLLFLYQSATVTLLRRGTTLRFIISIPLRNVGRLYQVYDLLPYASNKMGSKFYDVNLDTTKIAVSLDSSSYLLLPPTYLSSCKSGLSLVCPSSVPVFSPQFPSCAISAFQSQGNIITPNCRPVKPVTLLPKFVKGETPGVWYYMVSEPLKFTFECPLINEKRWGTVNGRGKIVIPPGCVARNYLFVLTSEWQNKIINVSNVNSFQILPFAPALFLTPVNPAAVPNASQPIQSANISSDARNTAYFSESKVLVKQIEDDIISVKNNSNSVYVPEFHTSLLTYSVGSGSALTILVLLIVLIILCRRQTATSAPLPVTMPTVHYVPATPVARCPRDT